MKILDVIRVANMYILTFSLLFIFQKYTIGFIPYLREIILFNKFYFYEILFTINAVIIIKLFVKIGVPKN
jgi:hypothetical protein